MYIFPVVIFFYPWMLLILMLKFFYGSNPSGPDLDATTGNNTHENFAILLLFIRRVTILKSFKVYFLSWRSEYIFNIFLSITLSHVLKYHRIMEGLSLDGTSNPAPLKGSSAIAVNVHLDFKYFDERTLHTFCG